MFIKNRYPFAVVSFNRAEIKTMELLKDFSDVIIFVENERNKELIKNNYGNRKIVITNTIGIQTKRNFIMDYFGKYKRIIFCDDDIDGIYKLNNGKLEIVDSYSIINIIEAGFKKCEEYKTHYWGLYAVPNSFYMSDSITRCGFCITSFCGLEINDIRIDTNIKTKDDYYLSAEHIIRYGGIVRFNNFTVKAQHRNKYGGLADIRTDEQERFDCEYLIKKYPFLIKKNKKRKNEILIKNIYAKL